MREIRFRGKRVDNEKWVYGGLSIYNKKYDKDTEEHYFIVETGKDNLGFITFMQEIDINTLGQFTGLRNKNGKEIYEGDILKDNYNVATVKFNTEDVASCGCCYRSFDGSGFVAQDIHFDECIFDNVEIIGNIHDNPELLKKEKKIK